MKNDIKNIAIGTILGVASTLAVQGTDIKLPVDVGQYQIVQLSENGNDVYMAVAHKEKEIRYGRLLTEIEKIEVEKGNEKVVGEKLAEESIAIENK